MSGSIAATGPLPDPPATLVAPAGRIAWLDAAKGLSILLVVLHHAFMAAEQVGEGWWAYERLNALFKPVRMPLFFLIAGMMAGRSLGQRWSALLGGRVAMLLYLYGLWTVIGWLYFRYVDPNDGYLLGQHRSQLVTMWVVPLGGQWFLWLLAIFLLFARAVAPVRSLVALLLICGATACLAESALHFPHYSWRNALLYAPFFIAGHWYGRQIVAWLPQHLGLGLLGAGMCYGGAVALLGIEALASGSVRQPPGLRLLLSTAGLALGLSLSLLLSRSARLRDHLSLIGRNSLSIYLAHGMLLSVAAIGLVHLPLPPFAPVWVTPLLLLLAVPASLGMRLALGRLGERWLYSDAGPRTLMSAMRARALKRHQASVR